MASHGEGMSWDAERAAARKRTREAHERKGSVQAHHRSVSAVSQYPAYPALATAQIENRPARRRQQAEDGREVHLLVPRIPARAARQPRPALCL